ncbi:MAG TPA: hypothetical protein VF737_15515 [Gemmatimonadaceae bacterium]
MRIHLFTGLLFALLGARALSAQDSTGFVASESCLDHLPPGAFFQVGVYAYVHVDPGLGKQARFAAEDFLQAVVEAAARLLGAPPGVLPRGDPTLTWKQLAGSLRVTAYADGRMNWIADSTPHGPTAATRLLAVAVSDARRNGATMMLPQDARGQALDSLTFLIRTTHPRVSEAGTPDSMTFEGTAIPIFSAPVPWEEAVRFPRRAPQLWYPDDARASMATATVVERFTVDTTGRVVPGSIHEVWPAGVKPPMGDLGRYWDEFVASTHKWLYSGRFSPARIGGCRVQQVVEQRFAFDLRPDDTDAPPAL